jgi:urease subunit gamma/beta
VHLNPRETDKLLLHLAGSVAQKRYADGLALNLPETTALISSVLLELIRRDHGVSELMNLGKAILGLHDVMPGVGDLLAEVQIEGTFPDGTKLVTVHEPVCREEGNESLALLGSGLVRRKRPDPPQVEAVPGEVAVGEGDIEINAGRPVTEMVVTNRGDRPVQVGSHYPFSETNPLLEFDRRGAVGKRLDIAAGTAVRFEPGESRAVRLVPAGGFARTHGAQGFLDGPEDPDAVARALERMFAEGFLGAEILP